MADYSDPYHWDALEELKRYNESVRSACLHLGIKPTGPEGMLRLGDIVLYLERHMPWLISKSELED